MAIDYVLDALRIEPAHTEDLDVILGIEEVSFSGPWTRRMFEAELSGNPFARLFRATLPQGVFDQGGIVGYICIWCVFEELRILNLAVSPLVRRRGIATHMVKFVLAYGMSQGTTRALLEVRASNVPALSLYNLFGFREYGKRTGYYTNPKEDAILMDLDPIVSPGKQHSEEMS